MKVSYVSSQSISQALRQSLLRMQSDLVGAQQESQNGRLSDVGMALGIRTGQVVSLQRDVDRLKGIVDSNELVASRIAATQNALGQISTSAESLLSAMTTAVSGDADPKIAQQSAAAMLESLTGILNSSMNGEHIFAGVNTDVKPLNDFQADPAPANKTAFDDAFLAHFGFAQTDPAAEAITAAEMVAFMDAAVEPQFLGAGWDANWSNATDERIVTRISLNETAVTSASANSEGIRKLAMAAAMVTDLFTTPINEAARMAIAERTVQLIGEGMAGVAAVQADMGLAEGRIANASERLGVQIDIFEGFRLDLEGVDPYEAATRVNALITQIETSYALTARIQQLSLMKYL